MSFIGSDENNSFYSNFLNRERNLKFDTFNNNMKTKKKVPDMFKSAEGNRDAAKMPKQPVKAKQIKQAKKNETFVISGLVVGGVVVGGLILLFRK